MGIETRNRNKMSVNRIDRYQKNCEFLERNHNQEEKKKERNPREQISRLNNRWLELFTVWQR